MLKLNLIQLLLLMMCLLLNIFVHASERKVPKQYEQNRGDHCVCCLETLDEAKGNLTRLPCGHLFHYKCLLPWMKINMKCPTCKKIVDPNLFDPPLIKAIKEKFEDEILQIIENNNTAEFLHQLDLKENSPLIWAAILGKTRTVKLLIAKNASVTHQNLNGETALMYAISSNYFDIAKILIQTNPTTFLQKTKQVMTALMNAGALRRSASDVNSLFEILSGTTYVHHAIHQKDNLGNTPLIYAANKACDTSLIRLLIKNNANVGDEDNNGRTALCVAVAKTKLISVWKPLAQDHPEIWNISDNMGMTPLLHAARNGNYGNVKELVEHYQANVSDVDFNGKTALMHASCSGDMVFVNYMVTQIQAGEVNQVDSFGMTPLFYALDATTPHKGIVKKLIASGANIAYQIPIYHTEALNESALMFAIRKGLDTNIINQLINDATVNQRGHEGTTPLLYAVNANKFQIVKVLIAAGANPLLGTSRGLTPLMHAAREGYTSIVESLAKIEGTVNQEDMKKRTALFYAANQTEIVKILILSNANVNHKDQFGEFAIPREIREWALEQQTKVKSKKNKNK